MTDTEIQKALDAIKLALEEIELILEHKAPSCTEYVETARENLAVLESRLQEGK